MISSKNIFRMHTCIYLSFQWWGSETRHCLIKLWENNLFVGREIRKCVSSRREGNKRLWFYLQEDKVYWTPYIDACPANATYSELWKRYYGKLSLSLCIIMWRFKSLVKKQTFICISCHCHKVSLHTSYIQYPHTAPGWLTGLAYDYINFIMLISMIEYIIQTWYLTHRTPKWTPFRKPHFQMHFLEWECMIITGRGVGTKTSGLVRILTWAV